MKVDRRNFVQFAVGGALGAATSGVTRGGMSRVQTALAAEEMQVPGGAETWSLSNCSLCPGACGLRVRSIGGRVVRVAGNTLHPVNRGGLCPKALASLQELYHPDRLRRPMQNTGTRQAPRWREVAWEEAIGLLTRKLRELSQAGAARSVALLDRDERSLSGRLLRRFMQAYGSPHYLVMPSGMDALQAAVYWQQGVTRPIAFSWDDTRYLLSFGVDFLEGWGTPTATMAAFGRWRDSAAGRRTRFVQIESRLSPTAARADEWVPLRPGTEATLALGIAYVLITEGLCDTDFLRDHTFGFDDWRDDAGQLHLGFRSLVISDYRLDRVAAVTGVPAETILRLARGFGSNLPAVAIGDRQTSTLPGNPFAAMAVHSLNALVGSIGVPGGILVQHDTPGLDSTPADRFGLAGALPERAAALLINDVDPAFLLPGGAQIVRVVPFVAAFATFWNDTTELCDLIFPSPTGLEQWHAGTAPPAFAQPVLSVARPVIPPRHRTRPAAEVMLEVARGLRGTVAAALPFANFEAYVAGATDALHAAQAGTVFNTGLEEKWNRILERSGWWAPTWSSAGELTEQMKQNGGWWDPSYSYGQGGRVFQTKTGRFEFYSNALRDWASRNADRARAAGIQLRDDTSFLPHQPPLPNAPKDRLLLVPFEVLPLAGATGSHLPYLQQIAGFHLEEVWESWIELHPDTAAKLGIGDGDLVWLHTARGRGKVRARCYAGVHPDIVCIPAGYGHSAGPDWSRTGVNPMALVEERYEPVTGLPQVWNTYARIYRV